MPAFRSSRDGTHRKSVHLDSFDTFAPHSPSMIGLLRKILRSLHYDLIRTGDKDERFTDFEDIHNAVWKAVSANTMTSKERIYGVIEAVKYISKYEIEGDIVECGVW